MTTVILYPFNVKTRLVLFTLKHLYCKKLTAKTRICLECDRVRVSGLPNRRSWPPPLFRGRTSRRWPRARPDNVPEARPRSRNRHPSLTLKVLSFLRLFLD